MPVFLLAIRLRMQSRHQLRKGLGVIIAVPLIVSVFWTLIFFVLIVAGVVCLVWAVLDSARRPRGAFTAAGSSKTLWVTLLAALGVLIPFAGVILALVYLLNIRPRVNRQTVWDA